MATIERGAAAVVVYAELTTTSDPSPTILCGGEVVRGEEAGLLAHANCIILFHFGFCIVCTHLYGVGTFK